MSDQELKFCPLCKGEACLSNSAVKQGETFLWSIECPDCGLILDDKDLEKLIDKWNTRKPMDDIVERLEELKAKPTELCYDVPLIESIIKIVKGEER